MLILPTGLKLLSYAAAAFAEPRIAQMTVMHKGLSECLLDSGLGGTADDACAALVTLAVVIGTDVKQGMLVMVIPLDDAVQDMVMWGRYSGIGTVALVIE